MQYTDSMSDQSISPTSKSRSPTLKPVTAKPRSSRGRTLATHRLLADEYPEAVCELDFRNPFELLVATILAAQSTDVGVNKATPALFNRFNSPEAFAEVEPEHVEPYVNTIGLFRNKSKHIVRMSRMLVEQYNSVVPHRIADLVKLPGVGRKTANVVRSVALGLPGLPVDTHVLRLTRLIGLTDLPERDLANPVKVEKSLNRMLPAAERGDFSLRMILHGRRICIARRPQCEKCVLNSFCLSSTL